MGFRPAVVGQTLFAGSQWVGMERWVCQTQEGCVLCLRADKKEGGVLRMLYSDPYTVELPAGVVFQQMVNILELPQS